MGYHLIRPAAAHRRTIADHTVDDGDAAMARRVDAAAAASRAATFQNRRDGRSVPERADPLYHTVYAEL